MTSVTRGQLIPGLDQMPSFIAAPILSNVKSTLETAGAPELTDEALITILSSEQTLGNVAPQGKPPLTLCLRSNQLG